MDQTFAALAFATLLALTVAAAPVWPWSRRLGPRPMLAAGFCLLLCALFAVWLAPA